MKVGDLVRATRDNPTFRQGDLGIVVKVFNVESNRGIAYSVYFNSRPRKLEALPDGKVKFAAPRECMVYDGFLEKVVD